MSDLSVIQQAVAGDAALYDQAAAILLSDALDVVASFGADALPWQETLWAAQLAMEEVLELDASELTAETIHTAMTQKVLRIINGLDRDAIVDLRARPDAYVNRVFGME